MIKKKKKQKVSENVITYGSTPPYSKNIETKIGKQFLVLINKHFPKHNRHNIKVSYSCVPCMGQIISAHKKRVLGESQVTPNEAPPCNCRKKMDCPLDGQCRRKATIYQPSVKAQDMNMRNYVGLCETEFKTRRNNHEQSFKNRKLENATELSKYIWLCKDKGKNFEIKWKIIRNAPYKTGFKFCQLCLTEKLIILTSQKKTLLNKRSELLFKCRYKTKFKLKNFNQ